MGQFGEPIVEQACSTMPGPWRRLRLSRSAIGPRRNGASVHETGCQEGAGEMARLTGQLSRPTMPLIGNACAIWLRAIAEASDFALNQDKLSDRTSAV